MLRARAVVEPVREIDLVELATRGDHARVRRALIPLARSGRLRCPACGGPVHVRLGDLEPWRFVHASPPVNCPLEVQRLRDLTVHALARELRRTGHERVLADVRLEGPRGEALWVPLAARRKGLVRVFEVWEEGREPLEDARHRTRLHEAMGREVVWVLLKADPHGVFTDWLYAEGRAHYVAVVEVETLG